jgi:sterol desaturase/sphingolipid hydroxylase (fatty acid hydroxylase superfamily)
MGFEPTLVILAVEISLLYQTFLHTKKIKKLGFLELIFNTPSSHRVHHGSNNKYLDKNYGSILIIWDRLFGTYQKEEEKVIYGLTKPVKSKNPLVINITELSRTWKGFMQSENLYKKALWLFSRPQDSNLLI